MLRLSAIECYLANEATTTASLKSEMRPHRMKSIGSSAKQACKKAGTKRFHAPS